jgi:hypothetical protein
VKKLQSYPQRLSTPLWKTKKMNPFLIINTILTFLAAIWYFKTGAPKMGCLNLAFTMSNLTLIWIGKV